MDPSRSKNLETYLPYDLSEIPDQLRNRAKTELNEDEETRIRNMKLLRSMLKDEPNLRWQDDDLFLLSFLRVRKFDAKRAFQLMKNFYTQMDKHDIYKKFDYQDLKRTFEGNAIGLLPYRDSDGSVIISLRVSHWNPPEVSMGDAVRALSYGLLHANLSPATQIAGFKVLLDCKGFSLRHVPHVSPTYLLLLADAMKNCFPGRFRAIFVVNENVLTASFFTILLNLLTDKLKNRVYFCGKNAKDLHKHISPSILPADVQGELPAYDNTEWRNLVEEKADYLRYAHSHGYTKPKSKSQEKKCRKT